MTLTEIAHLVHAERVRRFERQAAIRRLIATRKLQRHAPCTPR